MKTLYCACLTNMATNKIEHTITSDAPLKDEMLPAPELGEYHIDYFETSIDNDDFIRAGDMCNCIESISSSLVVIKAGSDRIKGPCVMNKQRKRMAGGVVEGV